MSIKTSHRRARARRYAGAGLTTIMISSAMFVLGAGGASATGGPGSMSATPASVTAGSTTAFDFVYVAPAKKTAGTVTLSVPAGWTAPQKAKPTSGPGHLSVVAKTCHKAKVGTVSGAGPWSVPVKVNCKPGQGFTLRYSDVTAPTTAADDAFPATFKSEPLTQSPEISVGAGPVASLVLQGSLSAVGPLLNSPNAFFVGPRDSVYTAQGLDQYGNPVGDVTPDTVFSINNGSCEGNSCGVHDAGTFTVTGTDGDATGTATLIGDYNVLQMICEGDIYDINGNIFDGCEQVQRMIAGTMATATDQGDVACFDGDGHTVHFTGSIMSDTREHVPAVAGFDSSVGASPAWSYLNATGGTFCTDDVVLTLTVTGSSHPAGCYKMTVTTNKVTYSAATDATGTASISHFNGQYNDDTPIDIEIQKVCGVSLTEAVGYTVDGHL